MAAFARQVLIADDDTLVCALMEELLAYHGLDVRSVHTGEGALRVIREGFDGVVVLDVWLPDLDGRVVFERIRAEAPSVPVVFLTGFGSTDMALELIESGAYEYVDKANLTERLVPTVLNALDYLVVSTGAEAGAAADPFARIITAAPEMRRIFAQLRNAIDSRLNVLVRGESGTGKELIARAIHTSGPRSGAPFVTTSCASIPDGLLEAEMFGHERGAFTGATMRKAGRFELAHRGTLFLDEIGEMAPMLQAKLLRIVQEGRFERLGGVETLEVDVRIIAATHRNLEEEIATGGFREDLYYRLAVFTVAVPALRDRSGDIPLLVDHFVRTIAAREGRDVRTLDDRVMELLTAHPWPGNVRELENVVSYAVVSARGPVVTIADLPTGFRQAVAQRRHVRPAAVPTPPGVSASPAPTVGVPASVEGFATLADLEARQVKAALDLAGGNQTRAARLLGISRTTLYRKLDELRLEG